MRTPAWVMFGAMCALSVATRAAADVPAATAPAAAPDEERRTSLYREGVELANAGRWADAVKRFREVVAIRPAPPALFTLGQAEERLGQLATAKRTYVRALSEARRAGAREVADAAQAALTSLEPRVPHLVVTLTPRLDDAKATVDGQAVALGGPIDLDPGDRAVAVSAPARRSFQTTVHAVEGRTFELSIVLEPATPAPPAAAAPALEGPAVRGRALPVGPLLLGGAGLAGGAVGLALRLAGQSKYDAASAHCANGVCAQPSDVAAGNAARTQMIVGTVVLGAGVGALAAAAVWWAEIPRHGGDLDAGLHVDVSPSPGGVAACVRGTF